ncbi:tol-pal system-associated acyl-CoA thioesterase [Candidatus Methylospira mobilis]|uniref:Tol-pal system-associated acyl-CoA thioesterase n=1 Tax=Candidatus Methylospira mobilis TaxID=1808979 RepID=A0A5Q0BHC7_9GAMM|nr:tol-pal system-associated acyl-CoA thioesterase [Candidatus Methylospira mobilis]QFY41601.1 tol-pal system-associated acyl-CoA thioesterase [Candidatus Methylospira mobilis]WNV05155.1 tol-pal system-associated acyl-CoA thioesterase [Candidatus Methylospira mobilis]
MFFWPIRIYYEDTDAGGVVYYANYLRFYERARTEWLRAEGIEQDEIRQNDGILFVVRSAEVEYLRPALFNDEVVVSASLSEVRRASLKFRQEIRRINMQGELLSSAQFRIASITAKTLRPAAIPDHLMERIKKDEL